MELISREEAIKCLDGRGLIISATPKAAVRKYSAMVRARIEVLPTIEERKEGKWLDNKWLGEKCSVCGWELHYINFGQFKYCPNCGARMKGE